ncbi:ABC transporter permease [Archaeoglobus veneficus]|uniref:Putative ATP-dependent Na+ efflux pump n=1 Tax=Archaeoglobus veneficus (strain DSM 11195 / SNP6) TaxID=693661 RepID=F2KS94_ARCVS|nr:ABC transporter permease [Archaeoglobus veneficus]AEA48033.1 putative ATP-dependent Na+ efflux pump [Archaeoglobus veneficus SNP6]
MSVLVIAKHELLANAKRKEFVLITLAFPLFILIVFSSSMGVILSTFGDVKAGFVDKSGLLSSDEIGEMDKIVESVNAGDISKKSFKVILVRYSSEEKAREDLIKGRIDGYYVIDENYIDNGKITGYTKKASPHPARILEKKLVKAMLAGKVDDRVVKRVVEGSNYEEYKVGAKGEVEERNFMSFIIPVGFAVLLLTSILTSSSYLLQGIAEEKESRIMEILLSSVTAEELLFGKLLGLGLLGLMQISLWIAIAFPLAASFAILSPSVFVIALAYFILGYAFYASLISCIAAISPTLKDAQQMLGFVILPLIFSMMFGEIAAVNPSSPISMLLSYLPFTSPIEMPLRFAVGQVEGYEIIISVLTLVASAFITVRIASKLFGLFALSYTKPKIGDVLKSLRSSGTSQ